MKPIKKIKEKIRRYSKRKMDAKISRAEGYAQGSEDATSELMRQIHALNTRIAQVTDENLKIEENLRSHYEDRTNLLESRYTEKCKKCMQTTEAERERLRKIQNMILDLMQQFNVVFMKVFKHADLIVDEHDNVLKSSARIKASKETLMIIKNDADKILQKVLPLTSISFTENSIVSNTEIQIPAQALSDNSTKSKGKTAKQH